VGGGSLPGLLATALLLSSGCSSRNFSIATKGDASMDRALPSNADAKIPNADTGVLTPDSGGVDPFAGVSAAKVLAKLDFTRPVASTVMAGDNAIALFADTGLAFVDLSDPAAPVQGQPLPTDGKVVAVEYDEDLGLAYAIDTTGKLYIFSARSLDGFAKVYDATVPMLANKVVGIARIGSTVHVLTGSVVLPVIFVLAGETPISASLGTTLSLTDPTTHIAAGGGTLYLANKKSVQAWSVPAVGAATLLGQYVLSAEPRVLLAKGSKVLVGVTNQGLATVDFGNPATPAQLALDRSLADLMDARLFGRTLAAALQRNLTALIDLADFTAPRVLTVDQGPLPQFMAVLNGVLLRGTAQSAQVVSIPPTISISIPAPTASSFPLHGQVPVTFSKPIDAASAKITFTCAGSVVEGQVVVALERTSLSFIPQVALPPGVSCTLDLSAIKDASGLGLMGSKTLTVTTAAAASKAITNNGSKFPHVADGAFTDANEWSDVTPAKGMYTYFYGDYHDGKLNILNDWFFNSDKIDSDCYNEFYVWTGGGSEQWTIRAYADRKVTVLKNGVVVEPSTSGVTGGAGYGSSPNVKEPHTIYELQIAAQAGAWGVRLHDPGPTYSCNRLSAEPSHIQGTLGVAGAGAGATIDSTQKPLAPIAATLLSPANEAAVGTVMPTLTWTSGVKEGLNLLKYQVQIAKVADFKTLVWNTGTMSTSYTVPAGVLGLDKTYYWRIVASNSMGQAPSSVGSFFTGIRPMPDGGLDAAGKDAGLGDAADASGEKRALTVSFVDTLYADVLGPGQGTVTTQPAGIECTNGAKTCSAFFGVGTKVTLTASAAKGWSFVAWGGDCSVLNREPSGTIAIPAGAEPMDCTVRFDYGNGGTAGTGGSDAAGGTGGTDGGIDANTSDAPVDSGSVDAPADTGSADASNVDGEDGDAGDAGADAAPPLFTGTPTALAGDDQWVYFGQASGGGIYRYQMAGGLAPSVIVPGVTVPANGLAAWGSAVYWIDGDKIMRANRGGLDAGAGVEVLLSGQTGLRMLTSNHMADYSKTGPTYLVFVTGQVGNSTIKTLPVGGGEPVTIVDGLAMTAEDRVVADSGNLYWIGGSGRGIWRSEFGAPTPTQVGADTGVTGLARFGQNSLAYMFCSATACTLKVVTASTGAAQATPLAGLPATLTRVAGYSQYVLAYNANDVVRTTTALGTPSLFLSDELAADVYVSQMSVYYVTASGEFHASRIQ
jgi:hypothetical protein